MFLEKILKSRTNRNYIMIVTLIVTVFILVVVFINKNFFGSLNNYEQVLNLYNEVATDDVDINRIDRLTEALRKKTEKRKINIILNFE